jgi:hypothetical protein
MHGDRDRILMIPHMEYFFHRIRFSVRMRALRMNGRRRLTGAMPALVFQSVRAQVTLRGPPGAAGQQPTGAGLPVPHDDPKGTQAWLKERLQRTKESGRISSEAAAYYESVFKDCKEAHPLFELAQTMVGTQDTSKWSNFQQQQFSEVIGNKHGELCATNTQKIIKEAQEMKDWQEQGKPTGNNYWIEGADTLLNPDLPPEMKDEAFEDMKRERPPDSPAWGRFDHEMPVKPHDMSSANLKSKPKDY